MVVRRALVPEAQPFNIKGLYELHTLFMCTSRKLILLIISSPHVMLTFKHLIRAVPPSRIKFRRKLCCQNYHDIGRVARNSEYISGLVSDGILALEELLLTVHTFLSEDQKLVTSLAAIRHCCRATKALPYHV